MAGIDVGGGHGRRSVNQELPLVPFIDFLLCLVMFLLVTAVWSQMARLNADAQVPGPPNPDKDIEEQKKAPTSLMSKGLLDKLTRDEILDLLAYVWSRGDPKSKLFEGGHNH